MTHPLVVILPHSLGKAEATKRLRTGLHWLSAEFSQYVNVSEETWNEDRLLLQMIVLKQHIKGVVDVYDDRVRVEVLLPWLLARLAKNITPLLEQKGALMLEKR
jgi:Putative polyhydroxyalkanoic acid system protein (PHA_gran_rgn)